MSELVKTWTDWLLNHRFSYMNETQKQQTLLWLVDVRDKVIERAKLQPGDTVIDIGSGTGLLAFGAQMALNDTGKVIVSDAFADCVDACERIAKHAGVNANMEFLQADAADIKLPDESVNVALMRSVLVHINDKKSVINETHRILKPGGRVSIFEPIIKKNTRYFQLVPETFPHYEKMKEAELKMINDVDDPLVNFDENTLEADFKAAGFKTVDIDLTITSSTYPVTAEMIHPWFNTQPSPGKPNVKQKFMEFMSEDEINKIIENLKTELVGKEITISSPVAYLYAEK